MRLSTLVTFGLSSVLAYTIFQNKDKLQTAAKQTLQEKEAIEADFKRIKTNLATIKAQMQTLEDLSSDLTYKTRAFQQDIQPRLDLISQKLAAQQKTTPRS
ncbi:hypothetical protein [Streptococcus halichoeri]|uniref:hypothetical protein n=1 Tax=Streptococcus halichoeri TaxID=254785 RepID=UPI00135CE348|nr:hypothetical protein [Streptococcus halichoeri]